MNAGALGRWLRGLTRRRDTDLHRELVLSAMQRDLSRERLRQVQARLDALQAGIDVQTSRRQRERESRVQP